MTDTSTTEYSTLEAGNQVQSMKTSLNLTSIEEYTKKYFPPSGDLLDIGGWPVDVTNLKDIEAFYHMTYHCLDIAIPQSGGRLFKEDITHCPAIPDNSFDAIVSIDTFEHLKEPWLAAKEITRILKPGGVCSIGTVFSWRYHPVPVDYWRFSPECLQSLFKDLQCLESNWDRSRRRHNYNGELDALDYCPIDEIGAWKENWRVFYVGKKI
jgi:SAM-dependent methyltransferase